MGDFVEPLHAVNAAMLERPELGRERTRGRLQELGQVEVIGAEADPQLAQGGAAGLVEGLGILGHPRALQNAECLADLEGDAAADAFDPFALFEVGEGAEQLLDVLADPKVDAALDHLEGRTGQLVIRQHPYTRLQDVLARGQLANRLAEPADRAIIGQHEGIVDGVVDALGTSFDLARQGLLGCGIEGPGRLASRLRIRGEAESLQLTDVLALHHHVSRPCNFRFQHRVLSQTTHQDARPAVHETMRQAFVECVGQAVLYLTSHALPMLRIA